MRLSCIGTDVVHGLSLNLTALDADPELDRCLSLEPWARNGYGVVLTLLFLKVRTSPGPQSSPRELKEGGGGAVVLRPSPPCS